MLTPERHRKILSLLTEKEIVKLQELVDATDASESTIRRDLIQLENEKKLKRVHGGASLLHQKGEELSVFEKLAKNLDEKDAIAKYAASLVNDGDCLYLDAGTTTHQMIAYITSKNIKVVTNGITHLETLLEQDIETYSTGGLIKKKTKAFIGRGALEGIQQYRFDKCFIGVNGIQIDCGFTTPDPEEALIKSLAIRLSQQAFVLADHSKFNEITFAKITDLEKATIITNESDQEILAPYRKNTFIKVVST
ncbi:DeoR/GlpR family DNA-binding transcription regulator [Bacillus sp. Marseille-P3661]|uniref:DeoR/GlpR family DNA-binding transcription regulator n=1 Tax=Bacillus sp. Marseille-P3661 TaxID=1936234 RepID=UPI000C84E0BF|nr:DeoR/GlpR family DNA-binding transcription regulator [Bacillus sp. Marseille-P3661]